MAYWICRIEVWYSTVPHVVLGSVPQDMSSVFMEMLPFLVSVLKILKEIFELVYLGGILMEVVSLEILCFTTLGLIFQHNHSMRDILIQE